jgi:hypothetical protein
MGICMVARTLSDEKIQTIMTDPPLVWRVVSPEDVDFYLMESGQSKPPGLFARILGTKREWPPKVLEFEFAEGELQEVDLDKSWDGINFCIKKIARSSGYPNLFADGKAVGKVEVGYGPALCFESNDVAKIAELYASISEAELLAQYVPAEMKGVYLDGLWQRDGDESRSYLTENFAFLKTFLDLAKKNRLGIVIQYT